MEVKYAKGGTIPLALFVMLMLLLNPCCGAAVIVKSNNTVICDGRLHECLIEDDLELELVINPYISRMLKYDAAVCSDCSKNKDSACTDPCSTKDCIKRNLYDRTPCKPQPSAWWQCISSQLNTYYRRFWRKSYYYYYFLFSFSLYFFLSLFVSR